jgi:hypothetical protein
LEWSALGVWSRGGIGAMGSAIRDRVRSTEQKYRAHIDETKIFNHVLMPYNAQLYQYFL